MLAAAQRTLSIPTPTAFDAWLIGRCMDDDDIKKDTKHWPFKVTEKKGKPYITVKHKGLDYNFVSAYFLTLRQKRNKRYGRRKLTRLPWVKKSLTPSSASRPVSVVAQRWRLTNFFFLPQQRRVWVKRC